MYRLLSITLLIILLAGCSGTNSLKISTIPSGAKIYANDSYIGTSPCNVPSKWNVLWSDTVRLNIKKDGYADESLNITTEEIRIMKKNEEYEDDSEFGTGNTFPFTFKLQKK